jgi:hypothetical protein
MNEQELWIQEKLWVIKKKMNNFSPMHISLILEHNFSEM